MNHGRLIMIEMKCFSFVKCISGTCVDICRPGSRIEISQQLPSIQELEIDPGEDWLL